LSKPAQKLRKRMKRNPAGLDLHLVMMDRISFADETSPVAPGIGHHGLAHGILRKSLEEAGLPPIRLYDLRHTAATPALSAGVPVRVVGEMPGHSSVALTLDVYSHVLPYIQEDAARKMATLAGVLARRPEMDLPDRRNSQEFRPE